MRISFLPSLTCLTSSVCPSDLGGLLFTLVYNPIERFLLLPKTAKKTDIQHGALDSVPQEESSPFTYLHLASQALNS